MYGVFRITRYKLILIFFEKDSNSSDDWLGDYKDDCLIEFQKRCIRLNKLSKSPREEKQKSKVSKISFFIFKLWNYWKFRNIYFQKNCQYFSELIFFVKKIIHYKTDLKHAVIMLLCQRYYLKCFYSCKKFCCPNMRKS